MIRPGGRVLAEVTRWDDLGERISSLAWSPDGSLLAVGDLLGHAVVFTPDGNPLDQLVDNGLGVLSLAWSSDGAHLAVGGQDGVVTVWDIEERRSRSLGHRDWIESLAWSPTSMLAVGAGADVVVYRPDGTLAADLAFQPGTVGALAWAGGRDGTTARLGVGCRGGIRWFEPPETQPVDTFASDGAPLALTLDPTGRFLAAGDISGSLHLWELELGDDTELQGYPDPVELVAWDGAGAQLAAVSDDEVTVWPVSSAGGELVSGHKHKPAVLCGPHETHIVDLAFRPGGALLATAGADGSLVLWDPATTTEPLGQIDLGSELACCAWRPGAGTVVVGTADGALLGVELWPHG